MVLQMQMLNSPSATSTSPPILFQWRFTMTNLLSATSSSFTLTNIQSTNAGDYDAVLTDGCGSVTSRVAYLEIDPTFTKITAGPIVTDGGYWLQWLGAFGNGRSVRQRQSDMKVNLSYIRNLLAKQ